jgi:pilus assembly protein Flp/PilA
VHAIARHFRCFVHDERGVTAIEYGIIAAAVALTLVTVMGDISAGITSVYGQIPSWFS